MIILTIGYGGRSLADVVDLLRRYSVTHLVDVRTSPFSKFAEEFNQDALAERAAGFDFRYVFMGKELGGRPECDACFDGEGRVLYEQVRQQDFFRRGIRQLLKGAANENRILCLMCSERKPEDCHRSKLIGEALAAEGVQVAHISESGELIDQANVMSRIGGGQYDLFGEDRTASRKSYGVREKKP